MYLDVSCQMGYRLKDQDTYRIHASSGTGSSSSSVHVRTLGDTVIAITLHKLNSWPECTRNQEEEVTHRTMTWLWMHFCFRPLWEDERIVNSE